MHVLNFKLFLEVRLSDIVNLKDGDSDVGKTIKSFQDMQFDFSEKLIRFITLGRRLGGKKIRMEINWNHSASHNLYVRIQNRTSFKSIDEFNQYFKSLINRVFPEKVGQQIFRNGVYNLYDSKHNMSILFNINVDVFMKGEYKITVVTILPGKNTNKKNVKIIEI